jgi:hypothetical protein
MCRIIHFLHFNLDYKLYLKKNNLGKLEFIWVGNKILLTLMGWASNLIDDTPIERNQPPYVGDYQA